MLVKIICEVGIGQIPGGIKPPARWSPKPVRVRWTGAGEFLEGAQVWMFRRWLVAVTLQLGDSDAEIPTYVKREVLRRENAFSEVKREVEVFEKFEKLNQSRATRRDSIPSEVKMYVWRRDEGKCVQCGSQQALEFDHVIPLAEGGSNTDRNLQLLCEQCNRKKGRSI